MSIWDLMEKRQKKLKINNKKREDVLPLFFDRWGSITFLSGISATTPLSSPFGLANRRVFFIICCKGIAIQDRLAYNK